MTLPNGIRRQTAVLLILAGVSAPAAAASGQPWDWMVSPYIWAAGVSTDIETRVPPNSVEVDTEFEDVIDKLDGAFEVHVEGRGDHVGVMLDFTYLGLAGEKDRRFLRTETEAARFLATMRASMSALTAAYDEYVDDLAVFRSSSEGRRRAAADRVAAL